MNTYKVKIRQLDWLDKENPEAAVLFELNGKQFWAFCHPCYFIEEEIEEVYFSFIEEEIPEISFWNENREGKKEIVVSENDRWQYGCYGQLKSIHPIIIDCGEISFSFGDWVNDERVIGSYVYFSISRLDINKI